MRRIARIIVGAVFLLIATALLFKTHKWMSNVWNGPAIVSPEALARLVDPLDLPNQWVSFDAADVLDAGINVSTTYGEDEKYVYIAVGGALIAAVVPADFTGTRIEGYLEKWSTPFYMDRILPHIHSNVPRGQHLLPYQLDGKYPQKQNAYATVGIVAFLAMIGVVLIVVPGSSRPRARQ